MQESHGQGYKRLEAENRRLRDQIKELKKQLERPSLRERQPLAPINENITDSKVIMIIYHIIIVYRFNAYFFNDNQMPAKGQAIARHQHMSKENM